MGNWRGNVLDDLCETIFCATESDCAPFWGKNWKADGENDRKRDAKGISKMHETTILMKFHWRSSVAPIKRWSSLQRILETISLGKNDSNLQKVNENFSRIHKGMKGAGTDEDTVIWNLIFTSEMCLENVKTEFEKLTKQSLEKAIKSEFRGDAEKLLLAVCKGNR